MNFFEAQAKARRRTGWLLLLLLLAVLCLIGLTQLLLLLALSFSGYSAQGAQTAANTAGLLPATIGQGFSWLQLGMIAAGVSSVVAAASLYKIAQLRRGGSAVAQLLGGTLLDRASVDLHERRLLNVVEEMAIASGMPVPEVYVIEDAAINAFAAGHDTRDVAIGITRGALQLLDRDELQGVIAHEFSHVFNGDMNINLRLIGILHGILFIGLIGRFLLDQRGRQRWATRDSKGVGLLMLLGLGLVLLGYCGTFFGNMIKAAISRQREFLADSSAVQYTRNPGGIAGALKKIAVHAAGSRLQHPNAAQISHLFFGDGLLQRFGWFATHPPLEQRILAIEPRWRGDLPALDTSSLNVKKTPIDPAHVQIVDGQIRYMAPESAAVTASVSAQAVDEAIVAIGAPTPVQLTRAQQILQALPESLLAMARTQEGAAAIMLGLLEDQSQNVPALAELPVALRLPLTDLCLPVLKTLALPARQAFLASVMQQIRADQHVSLLEWSLYRLLREHLDPLPRSAGNKTLVYSRAACVAVLSALSLAAHSDHNAANQAFMRASAQLDITTEALLPHALRDMAALDKAVQQLRQLHALSKPRLLKACCLAIADEGRYAPQALEVLRAIADSIDAPIPPFVAEQAMALGAATDA